MSNFADHTNYHTGSYPNVNRYYQTPQPYVPYQPQFSYAQPQSQEIPFAVPVEASAMSSLPCDEAVDYSRPQTWRNLPQQQDRGMNESPTDAYPGILTSEQLTNSGRRYSNDVEPLKNISTAPSLLHDDSATTAAASGADIPEASFRTTVSSANSTAVDTMWEARRLREITEMDADQKLIDAVCKASLAEFNQRERALKLYESETSQRSLEYQSSSATLQKAKSEAEQRKHAAMQNVISCKTRAKEMSDKAREATSLYEQKNCERLSKQAELEDLRLRNAQDAELFSMQKRKDVAMRKRLEAEQKAFEAREKAEAMRREAFHAASKVRANSRIQIESQLNVEEAQRQREKECKLNEIKKNRELARQRMVAAAKRAEDARLRAEELRLKAEQAHLGLKHSAQTSSSSTA